MAHKEIFGRLSREIEDLERNEISLDDLNGVENFESLNFESDFDDQDAEIAHLPEKRAFFV